MCIALTFLSMKAWELVVVICSTQDEQQGGHQECELNQKHTNPKFDAGSIRSTLQVVIEKVP